MSKTVTHYYPKSDGIISSKPNSCHCGNGDNLIKIALVEKNATRYIVQKVQEKIHRKKPRNHQTPDKE